MIELPMAGVRRKVLVSRERVKFTDADPYGHLASGAYVDMIMSHRVEVLEDLLGFSIVRYAASGIAFPARSVAITYLRPTYVGELLELASWIEELDSDNFELRVIVADANDRTARAVATVEFVTVDARTGRRVPTPDTLPSSAASDPLAALPTAGEYLSGIAGLPEEWIASASDRQSAGQAVLNT
jgi:acyl-CoA thioester hydrolase